MHPHQTLGFALKSLTNQIKRKLDYKCLTSGLNELTGMQLAVLAFVAEQTLLGNDVFQRDIEAEFSIRRSTVTGILQLMEKNGLIMRESVDYDARLKKLTLTDKACQLQQKALEEIQEIDRLISSGLTREELELFVRVLDKITRNLDDD